MRNLSDIIDVIEKHAPLAHAASWDHSGMQVASARGTVSRLAVLLDPTPAALRAAVGDGADMALSHHPLSMQPRFLDRCDSYHAAVSILLRYEVPLYSAHTSLDSNPDGPAAWLADALELTGREPLEELAPPPFGARFARGFGFCGSLPRPLSYADFLVRLGELLQQDSWSVCGPVPDQVRRVACCPGGGASYAAAAAALKADVLITGDVKYHNAVESPLRMLDVGHFSLEHTMMRLFAGQLARELPDMDVIFYPSHDPLAREVAGR